MASTAEQILMALAAKQAEDRNSSVFSQFVNDAAGEAGGKLSSSAQAIAQALMLPGDVASGSTPFDPRLGFSGQNPQTLDAAAELAGSLTLGSGAIPGPSNALRMGANYVRDLSQETPFLYRQMNPERANSILDNNLNMGAMGQERLHWADVPELAKGQGDNTGVRMVMRSDGVQGQFNTTSKPGLEFVEQTGGGREFVTRDGVSLDKVNEIHVDPEVYFRKNPDDRRMLNKLRQLVDAGQFQETSPDGFVTVYQRIK